MSALPFRLRSSLKLLIGSGAIAVLLIGAKHLHFYDIAQNAVQSALIWIKDLGAIGVFAYIGLYSLATVLLIPGSLLTLGGGAIYGAFWGSIYVFTAATLAATAAFLVGRYGAQGWVNQTVENNPRFKAIAAAVADDGFKIVLLTRLSPIFPFNLLNYAFGVTQVSLKDYVLGSIGMLPGTVMYVYVGSLAGDLALIGTKQPLSPDAQIIQWALRIVGLIATVGVSVYITHIARKALAQTVSAEDTAHDPASPE